MSGLAPSNVIIIHPDLGIGGAERLIIDVALALQNRGHRVTIYTSHRDKTHCFEEARDGTLDVRVRGNTIFPAHIFGRFHILMASLRQLHLTASLLTELGSRGNSKAKDKTAPGQEDQDDIFIVDQLPACVPILKSLGRPRKSRRQRILFYCHFPDQLLARRNEGGSLLQLAKLLYRFPFDWFEGWAMSASDRVVANSNFSRGVVHGVFGTEKLGDVEVVYPCVDTISAAETLKKELEDALWGGKKILLSINRFERKKDMGLAIRAYNGLGAGKRKGTRLVVAGKASYFLPRAIIMQYMETNSTSTSRWLRQSRPRKCPIPPRTRQSCQRPRLADGNDKDGSIRTLHP
jgi:alpha-1,3/alpha-1,6-mannosyltransferase